MKTPWIENHRGEWANSEGFVIEIRPLDEKRASVDLSSFFGLEAYFRREPNKDTGKFPRLG
jgi:hypothetical protein